MLKFTNWMKSVASKSMVGALDPALVKRSMKKRKAGSALGFAGVEALEPRQMLSAAPVNTVPVVQPVITNEDTATGFTNLTVFDSDDANLTVYLTATNGTLTATTGALIAIDSDGSNGTLAYFGSQANLNTMLGTVQFTGSTDYNGAASMKIDTSDADPQTTSDTILITVSAVNDQPDIDVPNPVASNEDDGAQTSVPLVTNFWPNASNHADFEGGQGVSKYIVTNVANASGNLTFSSDPVVALDGTLSYTATPDTFGTATFKLQVQDDGGGTDTSVTHTVTITVNPVNDKPDFAFTNPVASNEDAGAQANVPLVTNFWANGGNHADTEGGQTVVGYIVTNVSNATGTLSFSSDPVVALDGKLSYTATANTFGTATFELQVQDSGGGGTDTSDKQTVTITVNPVADAPTISPTTTDEDAQSGNGLVLDLNGVDGAEIAFFHITGITGGTLYQNNGSTVISNGAYITYAEGNAGLKFTPTANLNSFASSFGFDAAGSVTNTGTGLGVTTAASITVDPVADQPTVTVASTNEDVQSSSGLVISRNAVDGAETAYFQINNITGGSLFQNDGTTQITDGKYITYAEGHAGLKFTPTADWNSTDSAGHTFSFDAKGSNDNAGAGLGIASSAVTITVNSIADVPSVTNASTNEDFQTTSGLVITTNAVDSEGAAAGDVKFYKITGITNGTLYQNNGATAISNGDFITVAQGNAGLKFTPTPDLNDDDSSPQTFSFDVQSSLTNAGVGLSIAATASITVHSVADTPAVIDATTKEEVQSSSNLVITANAVDDTTGSAIGDVKYFKITGITTSTGTLYKNNGTTVINDNDFITVAEGLAGLKFTPKLDLNDATNPGGFHFDIQASLINTDDSELGGSVITANISVTPVNDAPTYATDGDKDAFPNITLNSDVLEDDGTHTITGLIASWDVKGGHSAATDEPVAPDSQVMQYYAYNLSNEFATYGGHNFGSNPFRSQGTSDDSGVTNHIDFSVDGSGNLTYQIKTDWYGTWTFQIAALDTGGTSNGGVNVPSVIDPTIFTITISPVADVPQVTVPQQFEHTLSDPALLLSSSDTGAPILIQPASNDYDVYDQTSAPDAVTNAITPFATGDHLNPGGTYYYKVSNVTNGVLYYNDDPASNATIIIQPGDTAFITIDDGQLTGPGGTFPGLRFLPFANLYNEKGDAFGFDIQATLDGADTGFAYSASTHATENQGTPAPETATHINIPVARKPDFVSDVKLFYDASNVTPGQTVYATISFQNSTDTKSFPQSIKIYRSYDGTLATLDRLMYAGIIPGVGAHHGYVAQVSWIADASDAATDGQTTPVTPDDGSGSNFLVAILDEEDYTGDVTTDNNWDHTLLPIYTVTVPTISIDAVSDGVEGVTDSGQFKLTRTGDTRQALTVYVAWNQTPVVGSADAADFVGNSFPPTAVTFAAGSDVAFVSVSPAIDNITEGVETLVGDVLDDPGSPITYLVDAGYGSDTIDIVDVVNTVSIRTTDGTSSESRSSTGTFRVQRGTGQSTLPVDVKIELTGSASLADDYDVRLAIGNVPVTEHYVLGHDYILINIPARRTYVDFRIVPVDDTEIEGPETVTATVVLNGTQAYAPVVGPNATADVGIVDNDDINLISRISGLPQSIKSPTNGGRQVIHFSIQVTNLGSNDAPTSILQVGLLSTSFTATPTDYPNIVPLQYISIRPLKAGKTYTRNITIRLNGFSAIAPGTYFLASKADYTNAIQESDDTTDNFGFSAGIITVQP